VYEEKQQHNKQRNRHHPEKPLIYHGSMMPQARMLKREMWIFKLTHYRNFSLLAMAPAVPLLQFLLKILETPMKKGGAPLR
jgi:hypothetical protein